MFVIHNPNDVTQSFGFLTYKRAVYYCLKNGLHISCIQDWPEFDVIVNEFNAHKENL